MVFCVEFDEDSDNGDKDVQSVDIEAETEEDAEKKFYETHPDEWFTVYRVGRVI